MNRFLSLFLYICSALYLIHILIRFYNRITTGRCKSPKCLVGKTTIVTGSNTGIGYETAKDFAKRGAKVILACRNESKAKEARRKIIEATGNAAIFVKLLDLSSFESVRKFAEDITKNEDRLDILVNNAGVAGTSLRKKSIDGNLLLMQANYLGPFLLTNLLLDLLQETKFSRIVNVSSMAASRGTYNADLNKPPKSSLLLYAITKLYNILFTKELARRLQGTSVTSYSVHPGVIASDVWRRVHGFYKIPLDFVQKHYFKDCEEGAQTIIYTALEQDIEKYNGEHFYECKKVEAYKSVKQFGYKSGELWEESMKIVGLN